MPKCSIYGCKTSTKDGSAKLARFYRLPIDHAVSQTWKLKLHCSSRLPRDGNNRVCSLHFTEEDFESNLQLWTSTFQAAYMDKILLATEKAKANLENLRFKERLQNAQQDLSSSLKSFSEKAKKEAKHVNRKARKALATEDGGSLREGYILTVNLDAGYDLCQRYQQDWATIHEASVLNVQKVEHVDEVICKLAKDWSLWNTNIDDFQHNLRCLSDLMKNVETAKEQVASINEQVVKTEQMMCAYEDACERLFIQQNKLLHRLTLSELVERKHQEYASLKASLEAQATLQEEARNQNAVRRRSLDRRDSIEKQKAYNDAFLEQMNQYISYGKLEDPIAGSASVNRGKNLAKFDDVKFEESDLKALKEFLGPEELNSILKARAHLVAASPSTESSASGLSDEQASSSLAHPLRAESVDLVMPVTPSNDYPGKAVATVGGFHVSESAAQEEPIAYPSGNAEELANLGKDSRKSSFGSDEDGEFFDAPPDSSAT